MHSRISYGEIVGRLVYYSQTELEIMGHRAQIMRDLKQYKEGIKYIKAVIFQLQNS